MLISDFCLSELVSIRVTVEAVVGDGVSSCEESFKEIRLRLVFISKRKNKVNLSFNLKNDFSLKIIIYSFTRWCINNRIESQIHSVSFD